MWPAPGSPHINAGRRQSMFPTQPTHTNTHTVHEDTHTHTLGARNCFVIPQTRKKYLSSDMWACTRMQANAHWIPPAPPPHPHFGDSQLPKQVYSILICAIFTHCPRNIPRQVVGLSFHCLCQVQSDWQAAPGWAAPERTLWQLSKLLLVDVVLVLQL